MSKPSLNNTHPTHITHNPHQVESGGESVVAKFFPEDEGFPFHEVCGNVVGTSLLGQVGVGVYRRWGVGVGGCGCVGGGWWV